MNILCATILIFMLRMAGLLCAATALAAQEPPETKNPEIPVLHQSIVITATPVEPQLERRNAEVFRRTLFSRDDQMLTLPLPPPAVCR